VGNLLLVFHFSTPSRGCGPVISIAVVFTRFSSLPSQFGEHLPFGFLHAPRGLSVTLGVGHAL
jgi:hypothetical protein